MQTVTEIDKLEQMNAEGALFILFGGRHCNVCHTLRPKLTSLLEQHYPDMRAVYVDCEASPQICAQYRVFSLPAVKVYIDGMLIAEDARAFSPGELMQRIERPYAMWRITMGSDQ
jgi:thioredoxin-like negative regulator of GroEL